MEDTKQQQQSEQPTGWRGAMPTARMSTGALLQFLDILNQRLCTLEDVVFIKINDKEQVSLTELYRRKEAEEEAQTAEAETKVNSSEGE